VHVALVTQLFPPEFEGGTEAVVLAQARALAERGHSVDVVCGTEVPLPAGGAMVLHDLVEGVRVHRVPRNAGERAEGRLQNPLEVRPRVRDLVLELTAGVELVHLHHWSLLDGSLVRALARRTPVAVTLHDSFALCPRGFRQAPRGVRCPEPQPAPALPRGRSPAQGGRSVDTFKGAQPSFALGMNAAVGGGTMQSVLRMVSVPQIFRVMKVIVYLPVSVNVTRTTMEPHVAGLFVGFGSPNVPDTTVHPVEGVMIQFLMLAESQTPLLLTTIPGMEVFVNVTGVFTHATVSGVIVKRVIGLLLVVIG
jgi:hypothetical protein